MTTQLIESKISSIKSNVQNLSNSEINDIFIMILRKEALDRYDLSLNEKNLDVPFLNFKFDAGSTLEENFNQFDIELKKRFITIDNYHFMCECQNRFKYVTINGSKEQKNGEFKVTFDCLYGSETPEKALVAMTFATDLYNPNIQAYTVFDEENRPLLPKKSTDPFDVELVGHLEGMRAKNHKNHKLHITNISRFNHDCLLELEKTAKIMENYAFEKKNKNWSL